MGVNVDDDNALRSHGSFAICFVFSRDIFRSWGGRDKRCPTFEMLSDLPRSQSQFVTELGSQPRLPDHKFQHQRGTELSSFYDPGTMLATCDIGELFYALGHGELVV